MLILTKIEQTFATSHNMLIPSIIFAFSLLIYHACTPFSENICNIMHISVYLVCFAGFITLLYFNCGNTIFLFLITILNYTLINLFKHLYGEEYLSSPFYINLNTLIPLNLLLFYFIRPRNLLASSNIWIILSIFIQFSIGELLGLHNLKLGIYLPFTPVNINIVSLIAFISVISLSFVNSIRNGKIMDYHIFFASLCLFFSFYYSETASGLCIFSLSTLLCLVSAFSQKIYKDTYKDSLTELNSRNSYIINSSKFPIKYSIGIVSIDDYNKLSKNFGYRIRNILIKLIVSQIVNLEPEENIYRYNPDEFVIIFKNLNKKEGFERLENIRRAIASAQFKFSHKRKPIKLTVSTCIAEKKRSDTSSFEVLQRADKVLQKARLFSHNITSQA